MVVLGGLVTGMTTLVESAAIAVIYAIVIECAVHRELGLTRELPRVAIECATLVGGFMIVLCVALGLTYYFILAEAPTHVLEWAQARIDSPAAFLLALNVFLIGVGALMDIYSAIFVVVPLVLPLGAEYGVHPVHLAVIFLANLELGYLMPPMGENLFLSSARFNQPLTRVYRSTLPYTALRRRGDARDGDPASGAQPAGPAGRHLAGATMTRDGLIEAWTASSQHSESALLARAPESSAAPHIPSDMQA